jgi:hypothetical protein
MPPSRQLAPFPAAETRLPFASWRARWNRLTPLARDIILILIVKAIVLGLIWFAFFRAPVARHMAMDPQRVEQKVLAPSPIPELPHAVR